MPFDCLLRNELHSHGTMQKCPCETTGICVEFHQFWKSFYHCFNARTRAWYVCRAWWHFLEMQNAFLSAMFPLNTKYDKQKKFTFPFKPKNTNLTGLPSVLLCRLYFEQCALSLSAFGFSTKGISGGNKNDRVNDPPGSHLFHLLIYFRCTFSVTADGVLRMRPWVCVNVCTTGDDGDINGVVLREQ